MSAMATFQYKLLHNTKAFGIKEKINAPNGRQVSAIPTFEIEALALDSPASFLPSKMSKLIDHTRGESIG